MDISLLLDYETKASASNTTNDGAIASQPRTPTYLPPELWLRIFDIHPNACHLWLTARCVSKTWRTLVTRLFACKYIQKPSVLTIYFPEPRTLAPPGVTVMTFSHFDPLDRRRCTFTQDDAQLIQGFSRCCVYDRTHEMANYSRHPELPPHVLMFKGPANDTELAGLRFFSGYNENSFDWQATLTAFFLESREQIRRDLGRMKRDCDPIPVDFMRILREQPE